MENWQIKPGHNVIEGEKNFQRIPDEKKYNQRITILFTERQLKLIESYCSSTNLTKGELFRRAIFEYLESRKVDFNTGSEPEDPRQTKMF